MGPLRYPQADSNRRFWLRRPTLYPLSYGGKHSDFTTDPDSVQDSRPQSLCQCLRRKAGKLIAELLDDPAVAAFIAQSRKLVFLKSQLCA
jgi:hypothetical protein